jgi:hypothetical protein
VPLAFEVLNNYTVMDCQMHPTQRFSCFLS